MLVTALAATSIAAASPGVALGRARSISEPSSGACTGTICAGPDKKALLGPGGTQVTVVGPGGTANCSTRGSPGLHILATVTQARTRAFGEGRLDLACPQAGQAWRLVVKEPQGVHAFTTGTALAALTYESNHSQWVGNLDLVTAIPANNPLAHALGKGSSGVRVRYAVLIGLGGLVLGLLGGFAVGRRKKTPAGA